MLLLIVQQKLAFFVISTHCWLTFNLCTGSSQILFCKAAFKAVVPAACSGVWYYSTSDAGVCIYVYWISLVSFSPFLQHAEVPLKQGCSEGIKTNSERWSTQLQILGRNSGTGHAVVQKEEAWIQCTLSGISPVSNVHSQNDLHLDYCLKEGQDLILHDSLKNYYSTRDPLKDLLKQSLRFGLNSNCF